MKKVIVASLAMTLLTSTLRADEVNLRPLPQVQRDIIARKLQDGEVCKVNLDDTRKTLEKCAADGAPDHGLTILVGMGAFLLGTFLGHALGKY